MSATPPLGTQGPSIGFFGILGSGNLGNDGSLEAIVRHVQREHPSASLGFMCMGPDSIMARYDAPATSLQWYEPHAGTATGIRAGLLKVAGKALDPFRTLAWVRKFDVVIVPGMGVLEATLPLRPWAFPYSLFFLGATAKITGTKVALVSVGSSVISKRATRWFVTRAARLADYRSFRDEFSRSAMSQMGVDTTMDPVYPDLAFALPVPDALGSSTRGAVGVGVMAYYGGNDDRARASQLHRAYMHTIKAFVRWLAESGRTVCLFTGDQEDEPILAEILDEARQSWPESVSSRVTARTSSTLPELLEVISGVETVIASRYHNVLGALKLSKPTLSIGYAAKHEHLMTTMGMGAYSQAADSIDLDRLIEGFEKLEAERETLVAAMQERNAEQTRRLHVQFDDLSKTLLAARSRWRPRRLRPGSAASQGRDR